MSVYHEMLQVETQKGITFQDVTEKVLEAAAKSGIKNGLVNVYSQHTSCSVLIQEDSEDVTYNHIPLILQDMVNVLEKIIPDCNGTDSQPKCAGTPSGRNGMAAQYRRTFKVCAVRKIRDGSHGRRQNNVGRIWENLFCRHGPDKGKD